MPVTVQQHIVQEQANLPGTPNELQWLMSGIVLATKMIQAQVRRAGLADILGSAGEMNVQGEVQQKLDVYANDTLISAFRSRESVGIIASEENERPITVGHTSPESKYAVIFDPLDGSQISTWPLQSAQRSLSFTAPMATAPTR